MLRQALDYDLNPADEATIRHALGDAYLMTGDLSSAIAQFNMSVQFAPCKTERYFGLVQVLREQNTLSKEAWASLVSHLMERVSVCHAIRTIENAPEAFTIATGMDSSTMDMYAHPVLFADLDQAFLPSKHSDILYSISYIYEKLQRYDLAYYYLAEANSKEKTYRPSTFNRADTIHQFNNTVMVFGKSFWNNLLLYDTSLDAVTEEISIVPVFVVGMMRSGSTLLESMLDSHSDIVGIGEESIFNAHLMSLRDALVEASNNHTVPNQPMLPTLDVSSSSLFCLALLEIDDVGYDIDALSRHAIAVLISVVESLYIWLIAFQLFCIHASIVAA